MPNGPWGGLGFNEILRFTEPSKSRFERRFFAPRLSNRSAGPGPLLASEETRVSPRARSFGDKAYRVRAQESRRMDRCSTVETGIRRTNKDINTTCSADRAWIYSPEISFSTGEATARACSRTGRAPAIIQLDKSTKIHPAIGIYRGPRQHLLSRLFTANVPWKILDFGPVAINARSCHRRASPFLETISRRRVKR